MKVIFKDYMDNQITEQQTALLGEYSKVFVMPGDVIKKEDFFDNNKLQNIHYYKDIDETEEEAREKLNQYNVPFSIREREKYGDFTIIRVNSYTANQLTEKWKFLADANDFILCTQPINLISGEPVYEQTTKYLGEYSNDLEPNYCRFNFDSDGQVTYCAYNYVRDYESELFELDRLLMIREKFNLTDEQYNYYLTADLLPPLK
ncbi:hypothetical protein [Mucilaginibacter flavidus]|uniref:hypothetical protein n=1 Tax=Mucilaginibacter flavidus TaxID=2949309 RepID=UPI0020927870|nr:hypothetical protein [Mucilaginibacter flavidus]MCO5950358.1 hypothetical protein [Mucilaginibacter flavidus]